MLFQVSPSDVMTFVVVPVILAIVGVVASLIPAQRATRSIRSRPAEYVSGTWARDECQHQVAQTGRQRERRGARAGLAQSKISRIGMRARLKVPLLTNGFSAGSRVKSGTSRVNRPSPPSRTDAMVLNPTPQSSEFEELTRPVRRVHGIECERRWRGTFYRHDDAATRTGREESSAMAQRVAASDGCRATAHLRGPHRRPA